MSLTLRMSSLSVLLPILASQKKVAGEEGFEPSLTDPESAVLPLDDSPAQVHCSTGLGSGQ